MAERKFNPGSSLGKLAHNIFGKKVPNLETGKPRRGLGPTPASSIGKAVSHVISGDQPILKTSRSTKKSSTLIGSGPANKGRGLESTVPRSISLEKTVPYSPGSPRAKGQKPSVVSKGAVKGGFKGLPPVKATPKYAHVDLTGKVSSANSQSPTNNTELRDMSQSTPAVAPPDKEGFFGKLKGALTAKPTNQPTTEYEDTMADLRGKKRKR